MSTGTDPAAILEALDVIEREGIELHSLLIWHSGALITEAYWKPFAPERPHMMHSVTKSFTSMAIGLAIENDLLALDDQIVGFFPDHLPASVPDNLARLQVRHLLTMTSGHERGISGGAWRQLKTSWIRDYLARPIPYRPGDVFVYDSASSYMLAAIVQKVTGRLLVDYLDEKVFSPMQMSDAIRWDVGPDGVNTGGNGLVCCASDMLKLGIVHLQNGRWNDRIILPEDWVREATSPKLRDVVLGTFTGQHYLGPNELEEGSVPDRREGYGYHWWIGPHDSFSANGLFGQYCIVLPKQNAVVAFTGGLHDDDRRVHSIVYDLLRPALGAMTAQDFDKRVADLHLAIQPGSAETRNAPANWSGVYGIGDNDHHVQSISLSSSDGQIVFQMKDHRGSHTIAAGIGCWVESVTTMTGAPIHHSYDPPEGLRVLACARWLAPRNGWACLEMDWLFVETAFRDTVRCWVNDGLLRLERRVNVNSSLLALPELSGRKCIQASEEREGLSS
ncbi:MAG: 6-aminohexanoate hydrolase [Rhizobiales bacterium]|nr:6-aminohexanoate hydrolase [Hyphomicrobiales bacterium]|tara:strand:- start:1495 stop:3006 length:1512 start_codon:yes stop_codon:yes gene_type:complete